MRTDLSEIIAENFGANATYVEGLLSRFRSNPELVDESWRTYFAELLGNGEGAAAPASLNATVSVEQTDDARATENGRGTGATTESQAGAGQAAAKTKTATTPGPQAEQTAVPSEPVETIPIRGAALKIVENMEASLKVPTATSQRRIPVKLLDENRRLINKHLQEN
ncbi:MAG: 2-oxoglutarate dehydrogenase E1 subunit family protein, partial [Pyrinomonadaceae bacterium]